MTMSTAWGPTKKHSMSPRSCTAPLTGQGCHSSLEWFSGRQKKHLPGGYSQVQSESARKPPPPLHQVTFFFSLFNLFPAFFKLCFKFLCICGKKRNDFLRALTMQRIYPGGSEEAGFRKGPNLCQSLPCPREGQAI